MVPIRLRRLRFETLEERRLLTITPTPNYEPADIRQLAAMFAPQLSLENNPALSQALDDYMSASGSDLTAARDAQRIFYGVEDDRIFASVMGSGTLQDLLANIAAADGDAQYVSADSPVVDAHIPLENLYELFDATNISSITPINIAEQSNSVGSVSNAAENVLRGSTLNSFRELTGAGITIGVISNGSGGLSTSQSTGDLPANVTVLNAGSGSEGTAMMELIHDIAPNAHLIFSSGSGSELAFRDAVNGLVGAGANIIVDDLSGLTTESFFADGPAAIAINNAVASGVTYFSSAGNRGDDGFESATHFVSSQNVYGQIGTFHDFNGTGDFLQTVSSSFFGTFQLQFDQLFGAVSSDVKLWVFDNSGNLLTSSTQVNSAALVQNPNDTITSLTGFSGTVQLAIQLVSGSAPSRMKWFNSRNIVTIEHDSLAGNLRTGRDSGHAAAVSNISVGASDFARSRKGVRNLLWTTGTCSLLVA